jgi:transcriptional regulator with XRE-family HTH domain
MSRPPISKWGLRLGCRAETRLNRQQVQRGRTSRPVYSELYTIAGFPARRRAYLMYSYFVLSSVMRRRLPAGPCVTRLVTMARREWDQMGGKRADATDVAVGQRIRALRKNAKVSQTELANQISVSFQQVQKYENGTNRVGAGRLTHIAKTLDVPITAFFEGLAPLTRGRSEAASLNIPMTEPQAHSLLEKFSLIPDPTLQIAVLKLVRWLKAVNRRWRK